MLGEYAIKLAIVLTGCAITVIAVVSYFKKATPDIKDVIIIAGFGYTAANHFYFGEVRPRKGKGKNPSN